MDNNNATANDQEKNQKAFEELLRLGYDGPAIRHAMFFLNNKNVNELAAKLGTCRMTVYNTIQGKSKNIDYIMGYSRFFKLDPTKAFSDILMSNV